MILYFSGTGNTRLCAKYLAKVLNQQAIELTQSRLVIPNVVKDKVNDSMIIWMFPIYSWGVPPVVIKYIKKSRLLTPPDTIHHMVATCGDDAGNADRMWRKTMKQMGYMAGRAFTVLMPNTYVLMKGFDIDTPEVANLKISNAPQKLDYIADELTNNPRGNQAQDDYTRGRWAWLKTTIIYPWFTSRGHGVNPKKFHTRSTCIACGKCSRECPMGNIYVRDNQHPIWTSNCAMCLRCLHSCPVGAITYGSAHSMPQKQQLPPSL